MQTVDLQCRKQLQYQLSNNWQLQKMFETPFVRVQRTFSSDFLLPVSFLLRRRPFDQSRCRESTSRCPNSRRPSCSSSSSSARPSSSATSSSSPTSRRSSRTSCPRTTRPVGTAPAGRIAPRRSWPRPRAKILILKSFLQLFFKWANPDLFFIYFWSFQTNNTILKTNLCEKMSCPSSIWRQDLNPQSIEHELSPITTRPGLPPYTIIFKIYKFCTTYGLIGCNANLQVTKISCFSLSKLFKFDIY